MMDDLIRRQDAVDAICQHFNYDVNDDLIYWNREHVLRVLKDLPSAQPNLQPTCNNLATDTISRQAAIDVILADKIDAKSLKVMTALGDGRLALTLNDACDRHIRDIEKLPSAEPEIVRCKVCIHHGKEICYFWSRYALDDGFCHKAERRTDEGFNRKTGCD